MSVHRTVTTHESCIVGSACMEAIEEHQSHKSTLTLSSLQCSTWTAAAPNSKLFLHHHCAHKLRKYYIYCILYSGKFGGQYILQMPDVVRYLANCPIETIHIMQSLALLLTWSMEDNSISGCYIMHAYRFRLPGSLGSQLLWQKQPHILCMGKIAAIIYH